MTDDLTQRAARHRHDPNWEGTPSYCIACSIDDGEAFHDVLWPCLVHDLAAALAAEQTKRQEADAEADRWCLTATAEKRQKEQAEQQLAVEQAARGRAEAALQIVAANNHRDAGGPLGCSYCGWRPADGHYADCVVKAALAGEEGR